MMCYKDMTFCNYSDCANFNKCPRRLTESVKKDAVRLGFPISRFAEQPKCFESKDSPETGQG